MVGHTRLRQLENTDRLRRLGAVVLLAIVGAVGAWMALRGGDVVDRTSARLCDARYAQARNGADSAVVDAYRPRITKAGQTELSCGELRALGGARTRR